MADLKVRRLEVQQSDLIGERWHKSQRYEGGWGACVIIGN
jgi:hypothetical protein